MYFTNIFWQLNFCGGSSALECSLLLFFLFVALVKEFKQSFDWSTLYIGFASSQNLATTCMFFSVLVLGIGRLCYALLSILCVPVDPVRSAGMECNLCDHVRPPVRYVLPVANASGQRLAAAMSETVDSGLRSSPRKKLTSHRTATNKLHHSFV